MAQLQFYAGVSNASISDAGAVAVHDVYRVLFCQGAAYYKFCAGHRHRGDPGIGRCGGERNSVWEAVGSFQATGSRRMCGHSVYEPGYAGVCDLSRPPCNVALAPGDTVRVGVWGIYERGLGPLNRRAAFTGESGERPRRVECFGDASGGYGPTAG